jgi:hypothetical protein
MNDRMIGGRGSTTLTRDDYEAIVRATCAPRRRTLREWWDEHSFDVGLAAALIGTALFVCGLGVCSAMYQRG